MDMSMPDIFVARVRAMQGMYQLEHLGLVNWGLWCRDRRGLYPAAICPPRTWDEATSGLPDGYAEEGEGQASTDVPVKSERAEDDPYDELAGTVLDERLHKPGGPSLIVREALVIAYVRRDIHEAMYPRAAGCIGDQFLERLEAGLRFASRFV